MSNIFLPCLERIVDRRPKLHYINCVLVAADLFTIVTFFFKQTDKDRSVQMTLFRVLFNRLVHRIKIIQQIRPKIESDSIATKHLDSHQWENMHILISCLPFPAKSSGQNMVNLRLHYKTTALIE